MKRIFKTKRGAIALTSILIISAAILVVTITVATLNINNSLNRIYSLKQIELDAQMDGCIEEALMEFRKNITTYTGSITPDCNIVVEGESTLKSIFITSTLDELIKEVEIQVDIDAVFKFIYYKEVLLT